MESRIAVHIVAHPIYDRTESRKRLLDQLANEPVNVYVVQGHPRHIGKGRYDGFKRGNEPYCSYVDDDDLIEPGIFAKLLAELENDPTIDAMCTKEEAHGNDGTNCAFDFAFTHYSYWNLFDIHHLPIFRRSVIEPYLPYLLELPDGSEHSLWAHLLLSGAKIKHFPEVGYHWNIHGENSGTLNIPVPPSLSELHMRLMKMASNDNFVSHIPEAKLLPAYENSGHKLIKFDKLLRRKP